MCFCYFKIKVSRSNLVKKGRTCPGLPYRVRSLALQPLSGGNSTEFSQADNSKTIKRRATHLTSFDSLGSCESIYIIYKSIIQAHKIGRNMN